ncbi:MAG: zinc dependent phospholipase C family protein [Deltaproteobacteria bacterium]|nr:zinc dependent phospholipase C family protein [Deltaproteobacteria bacterium]
MSVFPVAIAFLLLLLTPGDLWAWGMGVHLQVGSEILASLGVLPPLAADVIGRFSFDFLYGCISADITIGKKFTHHLHHCHSWRVGQKILDAADSEPRMACALGYLAHLGADTIGHSFFVPYKMVRSYNTPLLRHTYWEMRLEAMVDPTVWKVAQEISRRDFRENDAMMQRVIAETIFSFKTNKQIFNSLLLLSRLRQWRRVLLSHSYVSKWTISEEDALEYLSLAREAALDVLVRKEESPYWKADPTGERALQAAKMIRRNLNSLWLDGKLPPREALEIIRELKGKFRDGITQPDKLLELLSAE